MPFNKSGPLTQDELFALWQSVVDDQGYSSPLVSQPDSGIELIEQGHAQLAATSQAVDQTFQSLYILPWSGQTNDSASGAQLALALISVVRTNLGMVAAGVPLVFSPALRYLHAPFDYSEDGPVQVLTGRRYLGQGTVVLGPGELGPVTVPALSEAPAAGYNLPRPGTITILDQPGTGFSNDGASVTVTASTNRLTLRDEPEVLTPDQIGQYLLFTAGANLGRIARMVGYEPSSPGNGGVAILAAEWVTTVSGVVGSFVPGEALKSATLGPIGTLLHLNGPYAVIAWNNLAVPTTGVVVTGLQSGATMTPSLTQLPPALAAESGTAAWRVLDWELDLGVLVTNPSSPINGRTAVLDAIGKERQIFRSPGEPDDIYRERVATPADVVSPNAIVRATNRVLAPLGLDGCFREVGQALFRGFFYDGDPTSSDPAVAFAYDFDFAVRPQDRWKVYLDYTEFRAFFLIGVPSTALGEFGFAYDNHPSGAYDAAPYLDFYDGYPVGQAAILRNVYNNVNAVKAGGVGFDLYLEDSGCV